MTETVGYGDKRDVRQNWEQTVLSHFALFCLDFALQYRLCTVPYTSSLFVVKAIRYQFNTPAGVRSKAGTFKTVWLENICDLKHRNAEISFLNITQQINSRLSANIFPPQSFEKGHKQCCGIIAFIRVTISECPRILAHWKHPSMYIIEGTEKSQRV